MTLSVLDTTILSNFSHARRPELVQKVLNEQAATTPTVLGELRQGEALGLIPSLDWSWLKVLNLTAVEQSLANQYLNILDAGEAECLAVAVTRKARFFSDDLAARRLAKAHQVQISGTIGLLLYLIDNEILSANDADHLLQMMVEQGYRSPAASLQEFLQNPKNH